MIEFDDQIPGWATEHTLLSLGWLSRNVPQNGTIVEIGVLWGRLTNSLVTNKSSNTKVICIDPCLNASRILYDIKNQQDIIHRKNNDWINSYIREYGKQAYLDKIIAKSTKLDDVVCIQQSSTNVKIDYEVNMAIIDGNHKDGFPITDMLMFVQQPECLIVMDDWDLTFWPDVGKAIDMAHLKFNRAIFAPPMKKYVYILPQKGPMLAKMLEFIPMAMLPMPEFKIALNQISPK